MIVLKKDHKKEVQYSTRPAIAISKEIKFVFFVLMKICIVFTVSHIQLDNLHLKLHPFISPLKKCQFSGNTRNRVLFSSI